MKNMQNQQATRFGRTLLTAFAGSIALALFAGTANAATIEISTAFGNGADTYIDEQNSNDDSNFGTDVRMYTRRSSSRHEDVVLRFDLSGVSGTITDARLELIKHQSGTSSPVNLDVYGVDNGASGDDLADWSETDITYNTANGFLSSPQAASLMVTF